MRAEERRQLVSITADVLAVIRANEIRLEKLPIPGEGSYCALIVRRRGRVRFSHDGGSSKRVEGNRNSQIPFSSETFITNKLNKHTVHNKMDQHKSLRLNHITFPE